MMYGNSTTGSTNAGYSTTTNTTFRFFFGGGFDFPTAGVRIPIQPRPSGPPAHLYAEVGAAPGDSPEQVREAFRATIRTVHPDMGGTTDDAQRVIAAYRELQRFGAAA